MKDLNDLRQRVRERNQQVFGELGIEMPDMPDLDFNEVAKPLRRFAIGLGCGWLALVVLGAIGSLLSLGLSVWVVVLVLQWTGVL